MAPLYIFPVPNTKIKFYQFFAYGIVLINLVIQLYIDYSRGTKNYYLLTILLSAALFCWVIWDAYRIKKGKAFSQIGLLILIPALRWVQEGFYVAFIINLGLWFLYHVARRNMQISISTGQIEYPSFPKKIIHWKDLNNVVLKDDLLTIDCKNNKVYQHYIENAEQFANEEEFNDFCRRQLTK